MSRGLARLRRPGTWLWVALAAGLALRVALALATEGSFDVAVKLQHGNQINRLGLLEYYRQAEVMNHPPLMGRFFAAATSSAESSQIPFRVWLRLPFALLDLLTTGLLLLAFAGSPWRFAVAAAYWLHPLAILFSAYHGNTDSAVGCFALLSLVLASRGRPWAAGAALGLGLWVKVPVALAAPVLCLGLAGWRNRLGYAGFAAAVGLAGYLPVLLADPALVVHRIVGYPGSGVTTPGGVHIWGLSHVLGFSGSGAAGWLEAHNALVCLAPILLIAWLRRGRSSAKELGAGVCASFLALYGVTSFWGWQYLAWSIPFWFFLDWRMTSALTLVVGGYVYGAYAQFTGSPWLLGHWDPVGRAPWPLLLRALRDASLLLCLATAGWLLAGSWRGTRRTAA